MQRVSYREDDVVEHDLILVHAADDVHHDVGLGLIQHDPVVVQDDVGGLLGRLLQETLLEGFLRLQVCVGVLGGS